MRIGEDVRLTAQIITGRFPEAGKDIGVQHLEALLGKRQARGQSDEFGLHLRVKRAEHSPRRFRYGATGTPSIAHSDPILMPG